MHVQLHRPTSPKKSKQRSSVPNSCCAYVRALAYFNLILHGGSVKMELLFVAKVMMYSNFLMEAKMQFPFVTDVMLFLHFVSVTI